MMWRSAGGSSRSTASRRSRSRPFTPHDAIRTVVRFCFAKHDATLDAALARLDDVARLGAARRPEAGGDDWNGLTALREALPSTMKRSESRS